MGTDYKFLVELNDCDKFVDDLFEETVPGYYVLKDSIRKELDLNVMETNLRFIYMRIDTMSKFGAVLDSLVRYGSKVYDKEMSRVVNLILPYCKNITVESDCSVDDPETKAEWKHYFQERENLIRITDTVDSLYKLIHGI